MIDMTAMDHTTTACDVPVGIWAQGSLPRGVEDVIERVRKADGVRRVAVMPDVHLAGEFCVGMVVASEGLVFPNAVGGDIGCGMLALRFTGGDAREALADPQRAARLLGELSQVCPGRRHHHRTGHAMPEPLKTMTLSSKELQAVFHGEESRLQLGTLGAGNHFLELQQEMSPMGERALWLMIHTGSRHLGQSVLHAHLPRARRLAGGIVALDAETPAGRSYLADVAVARAWARENRRLLALRAGDAVERILHFTPEQETLVDCDHNHVQRETHDDREVWVHRKGATAAGAGIKGIVPGSMGTHSFHTVGKGYEKALCSSSHGAGRAMSRTEARDRVTVSALRQQLRGVWYDARLERQFREEAPCAYKKIDDVMAAQDALTRIERKLRPLLVYKGV